MVALVLVRTLAMSMAGTLQSAERAAGEPTAWKCCHPVGVTAAGRFHVYVRAIVQLDIAHQSLEPAFRCASSAVAMISMLCCHLASIL